VRSGLLPGLAAALVDCVRQRRHAPVAGAAVAITLLLHLMQHDPAAAMAEVTALGNAAVDPLLAIAADGDRIDALAAFGALTTLIAEAPALAARCAACSAALCAAARCIRGTGVGPTDPGCAALSFISAAASRKAGCADVVAAQPQVVRAAVRAVAGAGEAGVGFNAMRLLGRLTVGRPADVTHELLRAPGALASLVRQLSPPAEGSTRWTAAAALCVAVGCDEGASHAALQLGAMDPLVALFDTPYSKRTDVEDSLDGRASGEATDAALTTVVAGLHSLVKAAGDGCASLSRAVFLEPGGFVRALIAVAGCGDLKACLAAMSLMCALSCEASDGQLRLLAARNPDLVTSAAKALCCLLEGALVNELSAAQLCCPVFGSCPHILHTFGVVAIPDAGDPGTTFSSAAWVPEVVAALQAAVSEPQTAASSADAARAQQQGDEGDSSAKCPESLEMRRAAAELLQRLQAARGAASEQQQQQHQQQQQQQQQQQLREAQQQQQQQPVPPSQQQAGAPAAPPAAGAAAAAEQCAECGARGRLRLCRGCRAVRYCGEECARRAWKGGHRAECLAAQAAGQQPSGQQLQPQS
jgi:pyruvate/2-oxoglutarate dehydrogenase complex dihydrolipoamide acyltransferase (E2) component